MRLLGQIISCHETYQTMGCQLFVWTDTCTINHFGSHLLTYTTLTVQNLHFTRIWPYSHWAIIIISWFYNCRVIWCCQWDMLVTSGYMEKNICYSYMYVFCYNQTAYVQKIYIIRKHQWQQSFILLILQLRLKRVIQIINMKLNNTKSLCNFLA